MIIPSRKGRAAQSNAAGRYEPITRTAEDDGWGAEDPAPAAHKTEVRIENARTIISRNTSPDISFDRSVNPYRGCEHGCIYCYARPNHAYVGLSPGLDFETRLFAKTNAAERLAEALDAPGYKPSTLMIGGVTDAYQPIERSHRITRGLLEVALARRHPVALVTKSALVLRDLDLLAALAAQNLVKVAVSVTTLQKGLARTLEPRAAAPHRRLETLAGLSAAGVPAVVMAAPIIPGLTDHEIEAILAAAAAAGAREAGFVLLRLPLEVSGLFQEWLAAHAPERAGRVMRLVRDCRGGADYQPGFHERQTGRGPYAAMIGARFRRACARLGLNRARLALDANLFTPARAPPEAGLPLWTFAATPP